MADTPKAKKFDIAKSYRETKAELKKVTWPSRKELLQHTEVVATSILLVGAVLWIVDLAFGRVLDLFLVR
ncbi:MAG: preprotein translocase subunit SecE [Caulobacteraceae bacterium]